MIPVIDIKDHGVSDALRKLAQRCSDLSPVMRKIEREVFEPAARSAWASSGLRSKSGELKSAITPFAGKVSSGVGLRSYKGKDLVWPKAVTHTFGRKKGSAKPRSSRVRRLFLRKYQSPWGDIPARPFIPSEADVRSHGNKIINLIEEYINADAP